MVYTQTIKNMNSGYAGLVHDCITNGTAMSPRNLNCVELRPAQIIIKDPLQTLYGGMRRRMNYKFFAVEAMGYLTGINEPWYADLLVRTNKQYLKYIEDGVLVGAYGPRIQQSLREVADMLVNDRYTRQAVASIWTHPTSSMMSINTPCTCLLQFITNNRYGIDQLDLFVYMRSNDLNWGFAYDIPAFAFLLSIMAQAVGLPVGTMVHNAGSFHVYQDHLPIVGFNEVTSVGFNSLLQAPAVYIQSREYKDKLDVAHGSKYIEIMQKVFSDFLNECMIHVNTSDPVRWGEFTSSYAKNSSELGRYMTYWQDMMRFSWRNATTNLPIEIKEANELFEQVGQCQAQ